jgi:hypothetical protein
MDAVPVEDEKIITDWGKAMGEGKRKAWKQQVCGHEDFSHAIKSHELSRFNSWLSTT